VKKDHLRHEEDFHRNIAVTSIDSDKSSSVVARVDFGTFVVLDMGRVLATVVLEEEGIWWPSSLKVAYSFCQNVERYRVGLLPTYYNRGSKRFIGR